MRLDFDILFTVLFRHTYFASSRLAALSASPDARSMQAMKNHSLVFKPLPDGFRVGYDTSLAGRRRGRNDVLRSGLTLRFILALGDPHFYNYTALETERLRESVFYFNSAAEHPGLLHAAEFASEQDLVLPENIGEHFFSKPFGVIDIKLAEGLAEEQVLRFDKKTNYWQYIVVSEHLKSLSSPAILTAGNQTAFNSPETIQLPDKREALLFTSLLPIPLAERPGELFQLVEHYDPDSGRHRVVKKVLPVPDVSSVSSAAGKGQKSGFSEIFIY